MSTLLKVRLDREYVERASELLFRVGFGGLSEELAGRQVVLVAGDDDAARLQARRERFEALASEHGIAFEITTLELSDAWKVEWIAALEPVELAPGIRLVPRSPEGVIAAGDIHLIPALAFGYGEHATTRMASRWLVEHAPGKRVLDVGSGTGVLCFVAAHLGAQRALGIDIDEPSVLAARANAELNGLGERCEFSSAHLGQVGCDFDVVIANIDAVTLQRLAPELCAALTSGGTLGLTGILDEQADAVVRAFAAQGRQLQQQMTEEGWCLLSGGAECL
jgi:ribosomal protein L11 methyltransferase